MTSSIAKHVVRTGWPHKVHGEVTVTPILKGRFSSDPLWKVESSEGVYSLRGWPSERIDQARRSHDFTKMVSKRFGLPLPVAEETYAAKGSLHQVDYIAWELAPWLNGEQLDTEPNLEQLESAAATLAELHLAAADNVESVAVDPIQPYFERVKSLQKDLHEGSHLSDSIGGWSTDWPPVSQALLLASESVLNELRAASAPVRSAQWIWGDAWHGNVLFAGDRVAALVDFAAVRIDTPLADVARLLGAATHHGSTAWQVGIDAYSRISNLSSHDRQVVTALHNCGTVLSLANWIRWSSRIDQMPDPAAGLGRLQHFAGRLATYLGFSKGSV